MTQIPPWYVLTGGPCAGKTTTIDKLASLGHPVLAEPARLIIDEKLAAGQTIEQIVGNPEWLISIVRRGYAMQKEVSTDETFFFDRGLPDSVAYYRRLGKEIPKELVDSMKEIRYRKVFLLDLVDFKNDEGRPETPEEARAIHAQIDIAYRDQGYEPVRVPVMAVPERAEYILARCE